VRPGRGGDGDGDGQSGGPDDGADGGSSVSARFIWDNGTMITNGTDFAFNALTKSVVRGVAGATVLLPVTFINEGVRSDTYILIWANSQGWPQEFLPDTTTRINALRYTVLFAPFTIPTGTRGGTESQVRLTARSQGSPSLVQEETVRVVVVDGGRLWLPTLYQSNGATGQGGEGEQPLQVNNYYFPLIGD
jgi:hypothetical protein